MRYVVVAYSDTSCKSNRFGRVGGQYGGSFVLYVKNEMEIPSRLLEHVGGRIIERLFHDFPTIEEIELSLMKRNPPMGADIEAAGIELCIQRTTY